MELKLGETTYLNFSTHNSTGEVVDASVVSCEVFEDANDIPILTLTPIKRTGKTGDYRVQVDCTAANGFEVDKTYNVMASATTDKVGKGCIGTFKVRANHIGELAKEVTNQAEHDITQAAIALIPTTPVNVISALDGALKVDSVEDGGIITVYRKTSIAITFNLGKNMTGRKLYFAVRKDIADTVYTIPNGGTTPKEITSTTDLNTGAGYIGVTPAELNIAPGLYTYVEIQSISDIGGDPVPERLFQLRVKDHALNL